MGTGWLSNLLGSLGPDKLWGNDESVSGDKINLDVIGDDTTLIIGNLPENEAIQHQENDEIVIDPANAQDSEWEELKPALKEGWKTEEEVSIESAYPFVSSVNKNIDDEDINQTLDFFDGKIPFRFHKMLKSSLHLNLIIHGDEFISRVEIEERKQQIAGKYGNEAYSLANLCSAGYFDNDRFFRNLYHEKVDSGDWTSNEYEEEVVTLIREKPFVIFVSTDQTVIEVCDLIRAKLRRLPKYKAVLDFIDVRGINPKNHETIEEVIYELKQDLSSLSYEKHTRQKEMVVRIDAKGTEV